MAESSNLKLVIDKGPREGETLEYTSRCVVKIGRVVRGNTFAIKDAGISSKHICIKFDNESNKWTLSDLDSSNGTILNGLTVAPNVPSNLNDGDCIKIGELTSIIVKIEVESVIQSERKPRRQVKSGAGAGAVVERGVSELGLGFDGELGEIAVEEPVQKRNLRPRGKKAVDSKIEVEGLSSKRSVRSTRKGEKVNFIPTLNQIPESSNVEAMEHAVPIEPKKRGRKAPEDSGLDERKPTDIVVPLDDKNTRKGRKKLPVKTLESAQSGDLEENLNNANESVRVDVTEEAASENYQSDPLKNIENSRLEENLDTTNESAQDDVAENLEAIFDRNLAKDSSEIELQAHVDKGKERQDASDNTRWLDLEKMTLGDFFDYLEVQLPKEICEKSEKAISNLTEKARKYHEFRASMK